LVEHASRPSMGADEDEDPDLKAAIEASLREADAPKPRAPSGLETPRAEAPSGYPQSYFPAATPTQPSVPALPNHDLSPLESDTIITFSQTIEQVQTQGGGDMSRFPAVTQLFDNANSLRPKLARSLDDTGRKEELLTEMNDKLAQAVKLYDHILTQQVSHPTWRRQTASPPAQPLSQWNYVQSPISTQPTSTYTSPQAYQPLTGPGPSYAPPPHPPPQNLDSTLPRILRCQSTSHNHRISGEPTIPFGTYTATLGFSTIPIRTPNSTSIDSTTSPTSGCTYECDYFTAARIRCCATSTRTSPCNVTFICASPPAVTGTAAAASFTA